MIERWHGYEKQQQVFEVMSEMMRLTLQIVGKAL